MAALTASPSESVLLIDDDVHLCEMLHVYLGSHGWQTHAAHTGSEGVRLARELRPDLVILDVMLPDIDGFEVLRRLHQHRAYKVLMLTARGQEIDRIVGLEMGADDYLGKPFNPRELMARMKAILRRSRPEPLSTEHVAIGDFRIDSRSHQIIYKERAISLTDIEFNLLEFFLNHCHVVLTRDELSLALFERPSRPFDRALDMHISRLRKKLDDLNGFRGNIRSIRNSGYMFVMEEEHKR